MNEFLIRTDFGCRVNDLRAGRVNSSVTSACLSAKNFDGMVPSVFLRSWRSPGRRRPQCRIQQQVAKRMRRASDTTWTPVGPCSRCCTVNSWKCKQNFRFITNGFPDIIVLVKRLFVHSEIYIAPLLGNDLESISIKAIQKEQFYLSMRKISGRVPGPRHSCNNYNNLVLMQLLERALSICHISTSKQHLKKYSLEP